MASRKFYTFVVCLIADLRTGILCEHEHGVLAVLIWLPVTVQKNQMCAEEEERDMEYLDGHNLTIKGYFP